MNLLSAYLKINKETQENFSKRSQVPQSVVSRAINDIQIGPKNALKIENATDKAVTIRDLLYPD